MVGRRRRDVCYHGYAFGRLVRVVHHLVADEAAQKIHKLTNKSAMPSSLQIRCRVQIFCILLLQMFLFAENGSRGPQRLCGC